jgi:medium-chain acyl-[acyl-carrier-protein] hydrolase
MVKMVQTNKWMGIADCQPDAALRLFCFPYAGGGTSIFRRYEREVPQGVKVCPIELPGRGKRIGEPAFTHITPLVEAAAEALLPYFNKPFAFFGHSMGAKIAFELSRLLHKRHGLKPAHLFVSGSRAPQIPHTAPITYNLPLAEFIQEVQNLNGTPAEVLEHPELMELMVPLLRADFEVVQTYKYTPGPPLICPIRVFGGLQDTHIPLDYLEAWAAQTTSAFSLSLLPGDHFFINSARQALLQILNSDLDQLVKMLK